MGNIGKSMTSKITNVSMIDGIKGVGSLGGNIMGGIKNMGDKLKNMLNDDDLDDDNNNFGSASDYKQKFLSKYGVSFTIPSLYVQSSAFFPNDPTYFIQIVNTVVPSSEGTDGYHVTTHYW